MHRIAVDLDGRMLMIKITTAEIADGAGAQAVPDTPYAGWRWVMVPMIDIAMGSLLVRRLAAHDPNRATRLEEGGERGRPRCGLGSPQSSR